MLENAHDNRKDLLNELSKILKTSLTGASSEPQFVANLLWHFTTGFNLKISPIFLKQGVQVSSSGVFVHQQPYVRFGRPSSLKTVEIGDLLLCVTRKRRNGSISRNALLLQAKIIDKFPIAPDNADQHELYAYWPEFTYVRSGKLNDQKREITAPNLYNGAKYLLIPDVKASPQLYCEYCEDACCSGDCLCSMFSAYPYKPYLSSYRCFARELYDLIFGNAGRSFVYQPCSNNTNWDQVVTDLLDMTAKSKWMQRASGVSSERVVGFLCGAPSSLALINSFPESWQSSKDGPPHVPPSEHVSQDYDGGMSILEITLDEVE